MGEPDDIADLWSAVNELRSVISDLSGLIREIKAMLAERCDARVKRLDDIESEQGRQRGEIQELREHRSFSRGQFTALISGATIFAALVGSVAGPVITHFVGGK